MAEVAQLPQPDQASTRSSSSIDSPSNRKPGRRVLLLAFDFPPRRTSGVYRPAALTRYLAHQGWQTTVVTVNAGEGATTDNALLEKLPPGVHVVRTPYLRLKSWERIAANTVRSVGALRSPSDSNHQSMLDRSLRRCAGWAQSLLYFPDDTVGWVPFALEKALALHMRRPFDVIYTTHPPRAAHLVGMLLKLLCGVPWVAEFRDPWIIPEGVQEIPGIPVPARSRNLWLARNMIFRFADALIPVTQGYADELRGFYQVPAQKIRVIPNGFDEGDFQVRGGTAPAFFDPGLVHWSHFGTIYPQFSGQFFPVLARFVHAQPDLKNRLRVHIIGFPDEQAQRYAQDAELREIIQVHRFIPHGDALEAMRASHGLLLFYNHSYISSSSIPGKIYEYLRVGRPILALAYDGGVRALVEAANAGYVVPPDDPDALWKALAGLLQQSREGHSPAPPRPEFVAQFRYDRLARELAEILHCVTEREP